MDHINISRRRVTVRRYVNTSVPEEDLLKIPEAGRWSPTAVNAQPQRVLILKSVESLAKIREFCTFGYDEKYGELTEDYIDREHVRNVYYYGISLVLMVCYDSDACWRHPGTGESNSRVDATTVALNMMMEAVSLWLSIAWISYFDADRTRELLGIPKEWVSARLLYIGYPVDGWSSSGLSGERISLENTYFVDGCVEPFGPESPDRFGPGP